MDMRAASYKVSRGGIALLGAFLVASASWALRQYVISGLADTRGDALIANFPIATLTALAAYLIATLLVVHSFSFRAPIQVILMLVAVGAANFAAWVVTQGRPRPRFIEWLAISVISAFCALPQAVFKGLRPLAVFGEPSSIGPETNKLDLALRQRAARYRTDSRLALAVILLSLVGGSAIFVGADAIASRNFESEIQSLVGEVRQLRSLAKDARDKFEKAQEPIARYMASLSDPSQRSAAEAKLQELSAILRQSSYDFPVLDARLNIRTDGSIDDEISRLIDRRSKESATQTILSSLSTRIGSVLLLVFLVQILSGLYRYSARMAAHCESRADALVLDPKVSARELAAALALLAPDYIDFGKAPESPLGEVRSILEKAIAASSSHVAKHKQADDTD
jgi:hypothetical protein